MPNPKDYIEEDMVFVSSHVRRRRKKPGYNLLLYLILIGFLLWLLSKVWIFAVIIGGIILIILLILRVERIKRKLREFRIAFNKWRK
jgi:Flp pilus assembly protein TadB